MPNFVSLNESAYNAISNKDPSAIYFLSDLGIIINGNNHFGEVILFVSELPLAPVSNKIYILPSLEGWTFTTEWKKLFAPVSESVSNYTLAFNITSALVTGIQGIPIIVPENGTIESISAVCTVPGTEDSIIDIEKLNASDIQINPNNFVSIFNQDKDLIIPAEKITNDSSNLYELVTNNINKGDICRLNVKTAGTNISGLSIQMSIKLKEE